MKRVKVYRNLTAKCYSVMYRGIVIAHVDSIRLKNVTFQVSEAGRQRVLREKRKNVHAFIVGNVSMVPALDKGDRVSYNPYRGEKFTVNGEPIEQAGEVCLTENGVFLPSP
jgi:hypothetical protein